MVNLSNKERFLTISQNQRVEPLDRKKVKNLIKY